MDYTQDMSSAVPIETIPIPALTSLDLRFTQSPQRSDGSFETPWTTPPTMGPTDVFRWKFLHKNPFKELKRSRTPWLPTVRSGTDAWSAVPDGFRVQWLGHATFLIELHGTHLLIDPIFGGAGPGVPRAVAPPRLPDDLPRIDAVLITHGHYDHLDRASIRAVCRRWPDALVVVPQKQERSLPRAARRVVSLSWLEAIHVGGIQCVLTPAQHWHQRSPWDRNQALWGGYMIRGEARPDGSRPSVYHSGDTGWFDGFRFLRDLLGAPDVALLPLGAYEPRWFMGAQHMPPEDSLQAFHDLGARHFIGMHWGTFDLSDEPLDHGIRDILPEQVDVRRLSTDRIHPLATGGVLALGSDGSVADVAGRHDLPEPRPQEEKRPPG